VRCGVFLGKTPLSKSASGLRQSGNCCEPECCFTVYFKKICQLLLQFDKKGEAIRGIFEIVYENVYGFAAVRCAEEEIPL
jgi:hypothetical protein